MDDAGVGQLRKVTIEVSSKPPLAMLRQLRDRSRVPATDDAETALRLRRPSLQDTTAPEFLRPCDYTEVLRRNADG